jgi:hypothetical protein
MTRNVGDDGQRNRKQRVGNDASDEVISGARETRFAKNRKLSILSFQLGKTD